MQNAELPAEVLQYVRLAQPTWETRRARTVPSPSVPGADRRTRSHIANLISR
jgi:hypothetical protein